MNFVAAILQFPSQLVDEPKYSADIAHLTNPITQSNNPSKNLMILIE